MDVGPTNSDPQMFSLRNGFFSRGIDKPEIKVKADGAFHRLPTDGYVDAVAVTKKGRRTVIERDRLKGKAAYTIVYTVTSDGNGLVRQVTDLSNPEHKPIRTLISYRRSGGCDRKSHPLTGRWQTTAIKTSREHLTQRLSLIGDQFRMTGVGGYSFDAVVGGPPVSIKGDAETGRTAVTMPNQRTIIEHLSLGGVATVEMTMTLLPDNRTINVSGTRLTDGTHFSWLMHKQ